MSDDIKPGDPGFDLVANRRVGWREGAADMRERAADAIVTSAKAFDLNGFEDIAAALNDTAIVIRALPLEDKP